MVDICETLGDSLGGTLRNNQAQTTNTTKADTILSDIKVITPTITSIGLYFTGSKRSPFGESGSDYVFVLSHSRAGTLGSVDYNPLGSSDNSFYGPYEDIIVKQIDDIYREYLDDERFYDSGSSTGSWIVGSYIKLEKTMYLNNAYTYASVDFDNGSFIDTTGSIGIGSYNVNLGSAIFNNAVYIDKDATSYVEFQTAGSNDVYAGSMLVSMIVKMNEIHTGSEYSLMRQYSSTAGSREVGINTAGSLYMAHYYTNGSNETWYTTFTGSDKNFFRQIVYEYGYDTPSGSRQAFLTLDPSRTCEYTIKQTTEGYNLWGGSMLGSNANIIFGADNFVGSIDHIDVRKSRGPYFGFVPIVTPTYITTRNISQDAGSFTTFILTVGSAIGPNVKSTIMEKTKSVVVKESERGGVHISNIDTNNNVYITFTNIKIQTQQEDMGVDPTYIYNKTILGQDKPAIKLTMFK